jgi:hypothetical protein
MSSYYLSCHVHVPTVPLTSDRPVSMAQSESRPSEVRANLKAVTVVSGRGGQINCRHGRWQWGRSKAVQRRYMPYVRQPARCGTLRYKQARTHPKARSSLSSPTMASEQHPLPYGWVQEFDPKTNHPFWVRNSPCCIDSRPIAAGGHHSRTASCDLDTSL